MLRKSIALELSIAPIILGLVAWLGMLEPRIRCDVKSMRQPKEPDP
jgi:hypothetical protein